MGQEHGGHLVGAREFHDRSGIEPLGLQHGVRFYGRLEGTEGGVARDSIPAVEDLNGEFAPRLDDRRGTEGGVELTRFGVEVNHMPAPELHAPLAEEPQRLAQLGLHLDAVAAAPRRVVVEHEARRVDGVLALQPLLDPLGLSGVIGHARVEGNLAEAVLGHRSAIDLQIELR